MKRIPLANGRVSPRLTNALLAVAAFAFGGAVAVTAWAVGPTLAITVGGQTLTFSPRTTAARVNTTVTWTNAGGTHTVTSDEGLFDSGTLSQGGQFTFAFTKPGTYNYHCNFHVALGMVGTITIPGSAHDFNGDNLSDILWRDSSGNTALWFMNGATILSSTLIGAVTGWNVVGLRDFNGDTNADILWRDGSGNVAIWLMNGATVASAALVANVPTTWQVVGTGDFNGDGNGDILWEDNNGNLAVWLMNGASVLSAAGIGNVPTTWSLALTGDFNGDGKSDLLWRDTSGNTAIWFMNGTTVASTQSVGNISTAWTVQGTNAD